METKLHSSLATLKALMLKTPTTFIKYIYNVKLYYMRIIRQQKGNTSRVGSYYRVKSGKVNQNKQRSS
jgi:hypothetical protein